MGEEVEKVYGWVRFEPDLQVDDSNSSSLRSTTVRCRATNVAGAQQPELSPKQRGYLYNGWHSLTYHHPQSLPPSIPAHSRVSSGDV